MTLLPFDLTEVVHEELQRQRRPNDGLLHASSHIMAPLRHVQLDVAGAPKVTSELLSEITLYTGTMWHEWMHATLRRIGVPYMAEVNLNPWLPDGWGGTADAVVWNPELKAFVLVDFKTQKGEGMRYIIRDGAKAEHQAQASAYWYALKKSGIPLAKAVTIYYLPKNDTRSKDELIEPVLVDFQPLPAKDLHAEMQRRQERTQAYRDSLTADPQEYARRVAQSGSFVQGLQDQWITDELEPPQERIQRVYLDRKTGTHELKLVPHWTATYCPFPDELCDCSTQGTTKLGFFDLDGTYYARPGYEEITPEVFPE